LDRKMGNGGRKMLDVLVPLAACKLDATNSERETREVFTMRRGGVDSPHRQSLRMKWV